MRLLRTLEVVEDKIVAKRGITYHGGCERGKIILKKRSYRAEKVCILACGGTESRSSEDTSRISSFSSWHALATSLS